MGAKSQLHRNKNSYTSDSQNKQIYVEYFPEFIEQLEQMTTPEKGGVESQSIISRLNGNLGIQHEVGERAVMWS